MTENVINPQYTLTIESLAYGGDGTGRIDGRATFVPDTVPGDIVRVEIVEEKGSFCRARVVELLQPSPARVEPFCPYADRCGGCQWQMIDYAEQCAWKERIVRESLRRIGRADADLVEPCRSAPADRGWRTTVRLPATHDAEGFCLGYFARRTHDIVDIDRCPVATDHVNEILGVCRSLFGERYPDIPVTEIVIHASANRPSALITVSTAQRCDIAGAAADLMAAVPYLAGIVHRSGRSHVATYGERHRVEEIAGVVFRVDEQAFFQVNATQAAVLAALVREFLDARPGETIVDGYGGVGLFSLTAAPPDAVVQLYDTGWDAVRGAVYNARVRGMATFTARREATLDAVKRIRTANTVIVDPPRPGLGKEAVDAVASLGATRIVYVSCNPSTLARDIAWFGENGYRFVRAVPVDMFPHTYHVETVALLVK